MVTVSKVLDLVGIPSISGCEVVLLRNAGICCSIGDSLSQRLASIPARDDAAVQTVPHASKPARRHANFVAAVVAAIKVLSFVSVVLLE